MDFSLNDEQLALQETARRFAQQEIAPQAARYDQIGEFPTEIIRKAWELGLSSVSIPAEYGGVGPRPLRQLPRGRGARLGLRRHGHLDHVQRPRPDADPRRRQRRAEEGVARPR